MKIIKKLKALFFKDDQPISLDLAAAEIKEGRAYLHPKSEQHLTYLVRSDDIEIRLNKGKSLTDKDVMILGKRKKKEDSIDKPKERTPKEYTEKKPQKPSTTSENFSYDFSRFKKKTFSVSLYPEEYDALMEMINKYGYRRSDFILASAQTATQGTMAKAQKKVVMVRKEIRKEEKELKLKQKSNVAP